MTFIFKSDRQTEIINREQTEHISLRTNLAKINTIAL